MDKLRKLYGRHKSLAIVAILAFVLFIIMLIILLSMMIGSGKDKYGDRLEGIKSVEISKTTFENVKAKLNDTGKVDKVSTRTQGKIIYIEITYNQDVSIDDAKKIAETTLTEFSEKELSFYDVSYFLERKTDENNEEDKTYVISGSKHHNLDKITWIRS